MKQVKQPHSFEDFRETARNLLNENIPPETVFWSDDAELSLDLEDTGEPSLKQVATHRVPADYLTLAETVACHRDNQKWELLYRILWKLTHGEKHLLKIGLDNDVVRCTRMVQAIRRDCHKMKAFVRFREIESEEPDTPSHFVAWFEPEHLIVKRMASFFRKRFTNMNWSILTPDDCMHWNQKKILFTPGVTQDQAPHFDDYESLWLTYYKNIFNPARLKEKAMCAEMPKKYWKNLPEAELIPELIEKGKKMDLAREFEK